MLSRYIFRDRPREDLFRWRSPETSRIEGFSDAAFGFAITLLVVSLEVPRTSAELLTVLHGFVGFAFTFAILFSLWKAQFTFFRRYGLEDETTINLTGVFLFLVMFSVFPPKFLIGTLVTEITNGSAVDPLASQSDAAWLFFAYGSGFAAIFGTLALMYGHAYRQRERLGLSPLEVFETAESIRRYVTQAVIFAMILLFPPVMSMPRETRRGVALPLFVGVAGALAVVQQVQRARARRRREELTAALAPA